MTTREKVANYIEALKSETITEHSLNLFESGILTSLDVLDLISFVEDTFQLEISGDDVGMESFGTIDGIVSLIDRLQRQSQGTYATST